MVKFYLSLCCLVLMPVSAHAQLIEHACGHMPCSFAQFKAGETAWFNRADANHDGVVDAQELDTIWQQYAQDILPDCANISTIKMLKLSHLPTDAQMRNDFDHIDTNGDGVIDAQEDRVATQRLDQTCQMLNDPQVQKLRQMFEQLKHQ